MKLTDELLTQLINEDLERLDEKFNYPDNDPLSLAASTDDEIKASLKKIDMSTATAPLKAFRKLKRHDNEESTLSGEDVRIGLSKLFKAAADKPPTNPTAIIKAIINKMAAPERDEYKKAFDTNMWLRTHYLKKGGAEDVMFDKNFEPTKDQINKYSVTGIKYEKPPEQPTSTSGNQADVERVDIVGFDMRNAGSNEGQYPRALRHIFNAIFGNQQNFLDRLKTITNFSETMIKAVAGDAPTLTKLHTQGFEYFMKHVMALDYITSIVHGMESGSGAYQFESFLALIAGGKVEGKATSDVGGMGATDFTYGDNTKGSAKYYQVAAGLHQSARGFNIGDEVHYIVALKRGDDKLNISGKAASITQLDVYYFVIKREADKPDTNGGKTASIKILAPDGQILDIQEFPIKKHKKTDDSGREVEIDAPDGKVEFSGKTYFTDVTRQGSIKLLAANTSTFKETIRSSAGKAGFGEKLTAVEDSFNKSRDMKESLVVYTSGDTVEPDAGNDLIGKHKALKESLKVLLKTLTSEDKSNELKENQKLTEEILDKLIKEVIL